MLVIDIIDGNMSNGILVFEVNGNPNNGNNSAKKRWQVQWKVRPGTANPVKHIHSIEIKTGPGSPSSTDIFAGDGKQPEGNANLTHWKAKVDSNARDHVKYHYDINWVAKGNTRIFTHDPLISIRPTKSRWLIGILSGVLGLSVLLYRRKKRIPQGKNE